MEPASSPIPDRRIPRDRRARLVTLVVLVGVWAVGLTVLGAVVLQQAVRTRGLLVGSATADGTGIEWYVGFIASLGTLGWTIASGACATTAYAARLGHRPGAARAFRRAALLVAVLLVDDLFRLHHELLPDVFGVSSTVIQAVGGAAAVGWLVPTWGELRRTRWELLAASATVFATSVAVDLGVERAEAGTAALVVGDGSRFLGILALAAWAVMTARDVIRSIVRSGATPSVPAAPAAVEEPATV